MKSMLRKIGRLFVIKTRFEAWLVIYAIALGSVERGQHYMVQYPGWGGLMLALACTGVVFLAGGQLLDSVRAPAPAIAAGPNAAALRHRLIGRNRPRRLPMNRASARRTSRHRD
jgi:hypothetical protein